MEIDDRYNQLVNYITKACKSLKWEVNFEQDQNTDFFLFIIIDGVRYFVAPASDYNPNKSDTKYCLGVMVHHSGSYWEPPSEEDVELSKEHFPDPVSFVSLLLDSHWKERKNWIMEDFAEDEFDGA